MSRLSFKVDSLEIMVGIQMEGISVIWFFFRNYNILRRIAGLPFNRTLWNFDIWLQILPAF
jgi:hypothetical protein